MTKKTLTILKNLKALTFFTMDIGSNKIATFASFTIDYNNPNKDSRHYVKESSYKIYTNSLF